jgi:hypothetical protein
MKLEFSLQIFKKILNNKFCENRFGGTRVVTWRRRDGQTDIKDLRVAFRNFALAPKTYVINLQLAKAQKEKMADFAVTASDIAATLLDRGNIAGATIEF